MIDKKIIKTISARFSDFIGECMDENGQPKAPSKQALMRARGYLPPTVRYSLTPGLDAAALRHRAESTKCKTCGGAVAIHECDLESVSVRCGDCGAVFTL